MPYDHYSPYLTTLMRLAYELFSIEIKLFVLQDNIADSIFKNNNNKTQKTKTAKSQTSFYVPFQHQIK